MSCVTCRWSTERQKTLNLSGSHYHFFDKGVP
jgi:hypothetical protein